MARRCGRSFEVVTLELEALGLFHRQYSGTLLSSTRYCSLQVIYAPPLHINQQRCLEPFLVRSVLAPYQVQQQYLVVYMTCKTDHGFSFLFCFVFIQIWHLADGVSTLWSGMHGGALRRDYLDLSISAGQNRQDFAAARCCQGREDKYLESIARCTYS